MFVKRMAIISCVSLCACGFAGCGAVTSPSDGAGGSSGYLSVNLSEFGGSRALPVRDDDVTFKSTAVTLPEDLLANVSDELAAVVSAPDVAVMQDDSKGASSSATLFGTRHAAVTFRLAGEGADACASAIVIGPFGLTTSHGVVQIASELLVLSDAAKSLVLGGRFEMCAQTLADFDGLLAINKFALQFGRLKSNEPGVELCHIPPGDPDNRHTITVGAPAANAHLAHGDYLGPCSEPVEDLTLAAMCSDDPDSQRQWRIRNPNGFDVEVTWEVIGSPQTGTVSAPPGDSFFFTDTVSGANTTSISWLDENGDDNSETQASGGAECNPDADGDGVTDDADTCSDTPAGEQADALGCSCSQRDTDADGVDDCADACPGTSDGEVSDQNGCSCSQLDSDNDGVPDCVDLCLGTPVEETPDSQGCSCAQRDDDSDGVDDCLDACPFTPTDEVPDAEGCSCSQRDGDADGVNDCIDACPDTVDSAEVGTNGCVDEPLDEDDDGVLDEDDLCPATPVGEFADEFGCSCSQTDEDTDGMSDCDDLCPETPAGSEIDINGCAVMGVSAGPDVVLDEVGCLILQGSASGGTEPYTYSWSASGWGGSMEQNPTVVPFEPTTYTLTVTDWSSPPQVRVDAVTVSFNSIGDLQYTIVNLGSPEGNSSYASGLNDQGDVVGYYYTADWKKRAYLYTQGEMTELGSLGGGEALAEDINNAGQIVGKSRTADLYWQAFLWDSSTGMQNLGTLGGASSTAYAINESGQVAGHADTATGMSAFLYGGGAMADLGSQNYLQSAFFDINATAQAAGSFVIGGSNQNAFVYDGSTIIDLGSPLLDGSRAVAINDSQLVVGYSWGGGEYRSFIQACDTVIDLGALVSFPKTYAWDINNAGQVVGNSSDEIGAPSHAFVFTGGILYDLNDLLAPGHGWEFVAGAFAVNNAGQIAGYGRIDGEYRAFLMTPVQ